MVHETGSNSSKMGARRRLVRGEKSDVELFGTAPTIQPIGPRNTFDDKLCWMFVVRLPFEVYKEKGEFHAPYLLESRLLNRVWEGGKCSVKLWEDDFSVQTKYCHRYMLVTRRRWQGVDWAVQILKGVIGRHMDK